MAAVLETVVAVFETVAAVLGTVVAVWGTLAMAWEMQVTAVVITWRLWNHRHCLPEEVSLSEAVFCWLLSSVSVMCHSRFSNEVVAISPSC